MRDAHHLLVNAAADEQAGDFLMAVVGAGVDAFLHRHIVSVAVGRYHNVVILQGLGQFRKLFLDKAANDFRHLAGAGGHQVGVVVLAGGNHEVGLGSLIPQPLDPVQGGRGHVQQGNILLGGHGLHGGGIVRMAASVQLAVLEPAAGHRGEQHGDAALLPHTVNVIAQVVLVSAPGSRIAGGVALLGVVVAELDKHVVSRLNGAVHLVPQAQVPEALGAAAVLGIVDHLHLVRVQEVLEHHAPAPLQSCLGQVFLGHCAVAHQMDGGEGAGHQPD